MEEAEHLVKTWVFPAFIVGITLGLAMYLGGYKIATRPAGLSPAAMGSHVPVSKDVR